MSHPIKSPRKLIEVALPIDVINAASVRESYIYKGNPSSMHKWWAQRPLAAARAVIFAQLVNDPGYQQGAGFKYGLNRNDAAIERQRLFRIIEELVLWENSTNEGVLERARAEIRRSWREVCELNKDHPRASELFNPDILPILHDPFAGGGTIPLEAQRLGLRTFASDLNPVAVLINKAILEFPSRFAGCPPVNRNWQKKSKCEQALMQWNGTQGLAEDVRHYGAWIRSEAEKRIGHLYPPVEITTEVTLERPDLKPLVGQKLTVIAWIWARTVKSPSPAFSHVDVPLASTFILSSKEGKESYVQPIVDGDSYRFAVKVGTPPPNAKGGTKLARGANFQCLISHSAIEPAYIKCEGLAKRIGARLMAVVAESSLGRIYLSPNEAIESVATRGNPSWRPELSLPDDPRNFWTLNYGLTTYGDLFTPRQLVALTTLGDLVQDSQDRIRNDALSAGLPDEPLGLEAGGLGAKAYSEVVSTYLAFSVNKAAEYSCTSTVWYAKEDRPKGLFARHAIPMVWDFPEQNILSDIGGSFLKSSEIVADSLAGVCPQEAGTVKQWNSAVSNEALPHNVVISTDPPYYDNIGYADLSDFFYVWLRRSLRNTFPNLFKTVAVPKVEELVASPYRHGGKDQAEKFFLNGMTQAFQWLGKASSPVVPLTIYYAFKQAESKGNNEVASTGWVTFLEAVMMSGLQITGTWPMRTERQSRSIGIGTNSLASSIVLVCRKRASDAQTISRRDFTRELNALLPEALDEMTKGSIDRRSPVAPVDLSQAIIGPGMAVFSKYAAVLEADGTPMSVRTALQLINRFLAEDDFDPDTQWCLHWFEQHGWGEGVFGEADVLARAKATSVDGLKAAGVIHSGAGKVRLMKWNEYPVDWDPRSDDRLPIWEGLHQLIRALRQGGEAASGALLAALIGKAESVRQLAYRLYTLCERQGWAEDARAYNELITSWSGVELAASSAPTPKDQHLPGFGG